MIEPDHAARRGRDDRRRISATGQVYETPGHAPSHVCLFQPERRLLISGDHLLGRISLFFDYGWSPDPVGEFLASLDIVDALELASPVGPRQAVHRRPRPHRGQPQAGGRAAGDGVRRGSRAEPTTALDDRARASTSEPMTQSNAAWLLSQTLCYLAHLEGRGGWRGSRTASSSAGAGRSAATSNAARRAKDARGRTLAPGRNLDTFVSRLVGCPHHADR